jgi:large subunit ribosomal protein L30
MPGQLKITQLRGSARTKPAQRATLVALGLRRINHQVVQEDTPAIRGMIEVVKHLVKVETPS